MPIRPPPTAKAGSPPRQRPRGLPKPPISYVRVEAVVPEQGSEVDDVVDVLVVVRFVGDKNPPWRGEEERKKKGKKSSFDAGRVQPLG